MSMSAPRTALVTGGTAGIGREIARGLARRGCRVIIVGRDPARGASAAAEMRNGEAEIAFLPADLALVAEADRLAESLRQRLPALDLLVHSAGIVRGRRTLTAEGVEVNFATNYLARFALNRLLLPLLGAGTGEPAAARIVMISGAARGGRIHFEDVGLRHNFSTVRAVRQFCLANDMHTIDLARRLAVAPQPRRVTVSCLKVGVVKTRIRREFPLWMKLLVPLLADPLIGQSPGEVAEAALELALSQRFEGVSGALFMKIRRFRQIAPTAGARDAAQARRLWALSEALCMTAESRAGAEEWQPRRA